MTDQKLTREHLEREIIDTRRSWRAARRFVCFLFGLVGVFIGVLIASDFAQEKGDSDSAIGEFESALRDYVRAATQNGMAKLNLIDFERHSEIPTVTPSFAATEEQMRLQKALRSLNPKNTEHASAKINQAIAEFNYAQSANAADLAIHSNPSLAALNRNWERQQWQDRAKGAGIIAGSAAIGWIIGSCGTFVFAFVWWFLMDRLRDVSRAVKG